MSSNPTSWDRRQRAGPRDRTRAERGLPSAPVARILVVSDAERIRAQVRAVLPADAEVIELDDGAAVAPEVLVDDTDLAIVDLQVGSMGGFAVAMDLRLEESGGRI